MFAQRIEARAVVDPCAFEVADRVNDEPFIVTVSGRTGGGDPLENRVYEIAAPSDGHAAFEGINRYVVEMQRIVN